MINCSEDNNEWIEIKPKNKLKNQKTKKIDYNILTLEYIIEKTIEILSKYKPNQAYIYGSRARKTNRIDSDLDVLITFNMKNIQNELLLFKIKEELKNTFKIHVDLVVVYLSSTATTKKKHTDLDICYYENIALDGINIIGTEFNNIIDKITLKTKI
jgi:predicted nucleotidyltransferase